MQQTMIWLLSFLTYKVLLVGISILMVCMLYEGSHASYQKKLHAKPPNKRVLKKPRSDQRQKEYPNESLRLKLSKSEARSNVKRERTKTRQSKIIEREKSENLHQQTSSYISKKEVLEGPHSSQKKEALKELHSSQKEEALKKPHSSQKEEALEEPQLKQEKEYPMKLSKLEVSEGGENPDIQGVRTATQPLVNKIIGDILPEGWIRIRRQGNLMYTPHPHPENPSEQEIPPVSNLIILSNSLIPLQSKNGLWINPGFYAPLDLKTLFMTSKVLYLKSRDPQFKKFLDMTKKKSKSYMLHPAYKTCMLHMSARSNKYKILQTLNVHIRSVGNLFAAQYECLFDKAKKDGVVSYEFLRTKISSHDKGVCRLIVKCFFVRKFLEKRKWTPEDLHSSKNALTQELMQATNYYFNCPDYDFIPPNQEINQDFYDWYLMRMKAMKVPFCDCPNISRLLISSRYGSLKLFLFWDIFDALSIEISIRVSMRYGEVPFLEGDSDIIQLRRYIDEIYHNQRDLYFELVGFIQQDFFRNSLRYEKSQTEEQHWIAFANYIQGIRVQVEGFLTEVFASPLIAIKE